MKFTPPEHVVQVRVQQADPNIADPDVRWSDVEATRGAVGDREVVYRETIEVPAEWRA